MSLRTRPARVPARGPGELAATLDSLLHAAPRRPCSFSRASLSWPVTPFFNPPGLLLHDYVSSLHSQHCKPEKLAEMELKKFVASFLQYIPQPAARAI